jgi:hypothetical protein
MYTSDMADAGSLFLTALKNCQRGFRFAHGENRVDPIKNRIFQIPSESPLPFRQRDSFLIFFPYQIAGRTKINLLAFGDAQTSLLGSKLRKLRRLRSSRLKSPFEPEFRARQTFKHRLEITLKAAFSIFFDRPKEKEQTDHIPRHLPFARAARLL